MVSGVLCDRTLVIFLIYVKRKSMGVINIILSFISALLWGALAGLLTTCFFMYIIHGIMNFPKLFTAIWGVVMFFFLSFQYTAWIGASKVKGYIEDFVITTDKMDLLLTEEGAETTLNCEAITQEYPVLKPFLEGVKVDYDEVSDKTANLKDIFILTTNRIINEYMWHRFWWILLGSIVAIVGIQFLHRPRRKTPSYCDTNRGTPTLKF